MARVTIDDIDVMCVVAHDGPAGGPAAFDALEAPLASLRGRRFYGTFLAGEYRACVAIEPDDDPVALGLERWRIPGGSYERRRLLDWRDQLESIAPNFEEMAGEREYDPSRPSIEFYRSARELVLLQPVNG